jgi:hypothetical protein
VLAKSGLQPVARKVPLKKLEAAELKRLFCTCSNGSALLKRGTVAKIIVQACSRRTEGSGVRSSFLCVARDAQAPEARARRELRKAATKGSVRALTEQVHAVLRELPEWASTSHHDAEQYAVRARFHSARTCADMRRTSFAPAGP